MNDNNFGLFKITPQKGRKPKKEPMDLETGACPVAPEKAFRHPLEVAKANLNGGSVALGYLPRPGSKYVGIDIDNCLDNEGCLHQWASELLGDVDCFGVTPSGIGVRLVMPRAEGDEEQSSAEANNVGFLQTATALSPSRRRL
ncbi:MAG: hypothetical protein AAGA38_12080 [Pseudomonadota bacterium]